ncbi:MAG: DUF3048 domain-containing protein [Clostridia bacterium]|nr:DUF3048 domain-containing protein [Clostridia bacterium]
MNKKLFVRAIALLLCFVMIFTLSACKKKAQEENSAASEVSAAEPTAEPTSKPTPEPTPEPTPDPEVIPEKASLLTGLETLTDEAVGKRPVAVMINNVAPALPQDGVGSAEILFEIPIEYEHTRLLGVFSDYTKIPKICSVRSCRYYFPIVAAGFDAIYVHWGIDEVYARPVLNALGIEAFDGVRGGLGFYRDQNRLNKGYALEHTGYMDGSKFPEMVEKKGFRMDLKEDWEGYAFNFAKMDEVVTPAGETADYVKIDFGAQNSTFNYDPETKLYSKMHNRNKHIDALSGEQLTFTNVVVLETDITFKPNQVHREINLTGGENYKGYYFSNGAMQEIYWSKEGDFEKFKFFNKDGTELVMNRGKTYIAINYPNRITLTK